MDFRIVGLGISVAVASAQIPDSGLVGDYPFSGNAQDHSTLQNHGSVHGATLTADRFGNVASAYWFDGESAYLEIPDNDALSIATTGGLTISVWMRPDTLDFPSTESDNYVHWMGKGESGKHEWVLRMYSYQSSRPNRISCYAFNLTGGLGAGSYTQETTTAGNWIHIVARYNYPENQIRIYRNGVQKDQDLFTDYSIVPGNGSAPVRVGTRDFSSYFRGAIDDLRFYNRVLSDAEITALYQEDGAVSIRRANSDSRKKIDVQQLYSLQGKRLQTPRAGVQIRVSEEDRTVRGIVSVHPNP